MAVRKELSAEQKQIQQEARVIVKILGMLDGMSSNALCQVKDACSKRLTPSGDPVPTPDDDSAF